MEPVFALLTPYHVHPLYRVLSNTVKAVLYLLLIQRIVARSAKHILLHFLLSFGNQMLVALIWFFVYQLTISVEVLVCRLADD